MRKFALLTVLSSVAMSAQADVCQPATAPYCPSSGVTVLDDTYPVQSFVISQGGSYHTTESALMPVRTMVEAFRAYNFNLETMPYIIYPSTTQSQSAIRKVFIGEMVKAGKSEAEAGALFDARVRPITGSNYTWQQDYFESTIEPSTGQPRIRYIETYGKRATERIDENEPESFGTRRLNLYGGLPHVATAIGNSQICGMGNGQVLRSGTPEDGYANPGEYGGNIEGLPGGLCLVGDNMTPQYADQFCGSEANRVQVETSWLEVGHVDEIFKVVPNRNATGRPPECAFSILAADTDLGYSLLSSPEYSNRQVLHLEFDREKIFARYADRQGLYEDPYVNGTLIGTSFGSVACSYIRENRQSPAPVPAGGSSRVLRQAFYSFFVQDARATDESADEGIAAADQDSRDCLNGIDEVTGRQFANQLLNSASFSDVRQYNTQIQQSLVRSRETIYRKVLERLPQCRPFFPDVNSLFTPVPNVFTPPNIWQTGEHLNGGQVGAITQGRSMFPNPTNSVIFNNTVVYPGPVATPFNDYLDRTTRALGLTPSHVDTWDYAHTGLGNLHCSSHSLNFCRPRSGQ